MKTAVYNSELKILTITGIQTYNVAITIAEQTYRTISENGSVVLSNIEVSEGESVKIEEIIDSTIIIEATT